MFIYLRFDIFRFKDYLFIKRQSVKCSRLYILRDNIDSREFNILKCTVYTYTFFRLFINLIFYNITSRPIEKCEISNVGRKRTCNSR